jgi:hypothetical protein
VIRLLCASVLSASLGTLACDVEDESLQGDVLPGGTTGPVGTLVNVTLAEYEVTPSPSSAMAGAVTFAVTNQGSETHQFVVVETDLAAVDLPTKADGSFDRDAEGSEVINELEAVPAGATFELKVSLQPGAYVLLCDLVATEAGETKTHFHEGMHAAFTVQ